MLVWKTLDTNYSRFLYLYFIVNSFNHPVFFLKRDYFNKRREKQNSSQTNRQKKLLLNRLHPQDKSTMNFTHSPIFRQGE
jgi:hypothetical protein